MAKGLARVNAQQMICWPGRGGQLTQLAPAQDARRAREL
jgi:hypothetical protein